MDWSVFCFMISPPPWGLLEDSHLADLPRSVLGCLEFPAPPSHRQTQTLPVSATPTSQFLFSSCRLKFSSFSLPLLLERRWVLLHTSTQTTIGATMLKWGQTLMPTTERSDAWAGSTGFTSYLCPGPPTWPKESHVHPNTPSPLPLPALLCLVGSASTYSTELTHSYAYLHCLTQGWPTSQPVSAQSCPGLKKSVHSSLLPIAEHQDSNHL